MSIFETIRARVESPRNEDRWEQRKGIFSEPPQRIPCTTFIDAPLMGNGDVGVAVGGVASALTFYIGKNDFWVQAHMGETWEQRKERLLKDKGRRTGTRIITVGQLVLQIPRLSGAFYHMEQDIFHGEVRGTFQKDSTVVKTCSWVCAERNLLMTEISYEALEPQEQEKRDELDITVIHHAGEPGTDEVFNYENGLTEDCMWFQYAANSAHVPETRRVAVVTRVLGQAARYEDRFQVLAAVAKLAPGEKITLVSSIHSNLDEGGFLEFSQKEVRGFEWNDIWTVKEEHANWWKNFWSKSYVDIGDRILEKYYYGSYYILASCIRNGKTPPGLFGNWITTDRPKWTGSYTLNYNYESPYWCLYGGNHTDIAEAYCEPLLAVIPLGKVFADHFLGCRGVYLPVEMGPWGTICSMVFHDQKSNAAYTAVNLFMHYYHTYDMEYGRKVYPYLLEVAEFWEDYLVFEDGRYVIYDDSIHERSKDRKNPIYSMGLVQMLFKGLLDMSREFGINEDRYEKWEHILAHFSPYPLLEKNGRTVFRYTEEGMAWGRSNSVGTQHIYPAGMIGLDSDPQILEIARNTVDEMQRWTDHNAFPTYYTTAARVGYNPEVILENLRRECVEKSFPNLGIHHGGGGIEDSNGVPSCINEMLLQSFQGTIRVFPVWPEKRNARFHKLRAVGAFLVSSEYEKGRVKYILLHSEKGRECSVLNPWGDVPVHVYRSGGISGQYSGSRIVLKTEVEEDILLVPEGIAVEDVL